MKLQNKIAIITGGSSGIGASICHAYAKEGATIIVVNKNDPHSGIKVADQIKASGGNAEAILCDVTQENQVMQLIDKVNRKYQRIDILVSNAGVVVFKKIEEQTLDDWDYVINTNLKGPFLLAKAVTPYMKQQKSGKIIFISSIGSFLGSKVRAPYGASKAGILGLAKSLVVELAEYNINVNCILPGNVATNINIKRRSEPGHMEMIKNKTPSGIAYMEPDDITGAAIFLASEDAKAIHGTNLIIDNGLSSI